MLQVKHLKIAALDYCVLYFLMLVFLEVHQQT